MTAIDETIAEQEAAGAENAAELRKLYDDILAAINGSQEGDGDAFTEIKNAEGAAQIRELMDIIKTAIEKNKEEVK